MEPINDIMEILYTPKKGKFIDTVERFHIYSETHENNQINDRNTIKPNAIFDVINFHDPPKNAHWLVPSRIQAIHSRSS